MAAPSAVNDCWDCSEPNWQDWGAAIGWVSKLRGRCHGRISFAQPARMAEERWYA